jgi:hypothetical protein
VRREFAVAEVVMRDFMPLNNSRSWRRRFCRPMRDVV